MNEEQQKAQFDKACREHLTEDENRLLTYDQKRELLNYDKKIARSDRRYNRLKSGIDPDSLGDTPVRDFNEIGDMVKGLDLTDRQAEIVRLRVLGHEIDHIAGLLGVTSTVIDREIARIKEAVEPQDIIEDTSQVWHKKSTRQYDR